MTDESIVTVSHTNSLTFNAICRCTQTMGTKNFFGFGYEIGAGACLWFVFIGLKAHGYRGKLTKYSFA
ncbi:hypothetical protein H6G33_14535 [Calothrix sp. FACHB-1219]|uniref:hypothetical protein n=1 Tax=unclassified Calothrix TaxID=2619626 RepID=UPI0016867417|nr:MULTISPECIES: hypothetical protein [unclassified Calothrix]MBD2203961.1 hypothetical protein [Calothrix sp. FACHB-168]MBD2218254.1 hypothetical protein [Calothrix sp. FACHB-1219]